MLNELVKEINGKEYHFKFSSKKCIDLEKVTGKQFLELLQDTSMSNIARLLKASCVEVGVDEYELLDALMGEMSLERVMMDVIYEVAAISGIISREDKNKIDKAVEEEKKKEVIEEKK